MMIKKKERKKKILGSEIRRKKNKGLRRLGTEIIMRDYAKEKKKIFFEEYSKKIAKLLKDILHIKKIKFN